MEKVNIINVTIRDKPIIVESKEISEKMMKWAFHCLLENVKERKRMCELQQKIQKKLQTIILQRYFKFWRKAIDDKRTSGEEGKDVKQLCNEEIIESFIDSIVKKQENLKTPKNNHENEYLSRKNVDCDDRMNLPVKTVRILDPFLQNRLNIQKKIINEQRLKLIEQNRIIEEMKLKQIEKELRNSGKETINTAEKVLRKCGKQTRNTLMNLMKEDGNVSDSPRLTPDPPKFLLRMEARAERRRIRAAEAKEKRRKKLEEQKQRDEALRKEEKEKQKLLQLEIQRNVKRMHEEQEKKKLQEIERIKIANELASSYHKRYLLRNYIINPFLRLIEEKYNYIKIASNHYIVTLLKKSFTAWKMKIRETVTFKVNLCISLYNKNLLCRYFSSWINVTKEELKKYEVARSFYQVRFQRKYLRTWYNEVLESRMRLLVNGEIAGDHFIQRMRLKYFQRWKKYIEISEEVNESDKRKEKWRELIQHVIPDFSPKYRGVLSD